MSISLNNFSYSTANHIGHALKRPLFTLVCNIAISASDNDQSKQSRIMRIARVAWPCFVALIFVIPTSITWLTGKLITRFSKTQIDHAGLVKVPPHVQVPIEDSADSHIDIQGLVTAFDRLHPDKDSQDYHCIFSALSTVCQKIASKDESIFQVTDNQKEMFYKQLTIFLRGILKKIQTGTVPEDKQRSIFKNLADSFSKCAPTWIQVAAQIYEELHGQGDTPQANLLRLVQNYKEALILEFGQQKIGTEWHVVNFIRRILGKELGLDQTLVAFDAYAQDDDPIFSKCLSKWIFLQKYENANQLVSSIQTMINKEATSHTYHGFLVEIVTAKGVSNPIDFVADNFYNEELTEINHYGVNVMLKAIGILK